MRKSKSVSPEMLGWQRRVEVPKLGDDLPIWNPEGQYSSQVGFALAG
jgi:hypothetical protein